MGFLGATNSSEWGGSEIPYETYAQVVEEIAAGDGAVSTLVSVHNAPTCEILEQFGTAAQKEQWLRPMATGPGDRQLRADRERRRVRRVGHPHPRRADQQRLHHQRLQAVHLQRQHRPDHHPVRGHRPGGRQEGHLCLRRRQRHAGLPGRAGRAQAGPEGLRQLRPELRRHAGQRRPAHRRGGRRPQDRPLAPWRAAASASRRRASAWHVRRWTTRSPTPRSASSSASRSSSTRPSAFRLVDAKTQLAAAAS